ncbi:leucine-rich repeat neuronal protein 4 [Sceloporus undulatus]|uniref:leucine-rich repeat neuronal protein 4 n=1 Tax=Sceloporus undulatus TaxID=8520 RepID=UPI001C4D855C|nr:leucine-rich repeat neuronal protein 4 [Sceloporus undulatus]
MFSLLACIFLLVQAVAAKPIEKTGPEMQGDIKALFQLVVQNTEEENFNLTSLPCEEMKTKMWTTLRLKNQGITSFPACLPEHLEHLDMSINLLPEFHSQYVAYLPMLQVLSLKQNEIQQVTWEAGSLSSLKFLDLSFNQLSSVPECIASTMDNLIWLSLAGNPIAEIQPLAFYCLPQLHNLNLSSTWLGKDGQQGIKESAFATRLLPSERAGSAIRVLDLSMTFLESIHEDWIKDLSRLSSLYLTNMRNLRSLDTAVFQHAPQLKELDCQHSPALSLVETESFRHTPHLAFLMFQNCNLSSFHRWNLSSSNTLAINLYGNPLACHCAISWLISGQDNIVLNRASETMCYTSAETKGASSSGSMLLSKLYNECQAQETSHSTPLFTQGKSYSTSSTVTIDTFPDASALPHKWQSISFPPESTPVTSGDIIPVTWGDATKQGSVKTDILAYKEETIYGSTDSSRITAAAATTTSPAKLGQGSTEQTLMSTVEMDQRKQDATTVNSAIHLEGTRHHSALESPTMQPTKQGGLFPPHSTAHSDQTRPPLQIPTKTSLKPKLAITENPNYYSDDYDYEKEGETSLTEILGPCDYDPCRHLQKPCVDLQDLSPCLCPGISDEFTVPDPPRLWEVTEIRDTSAEIHWCAPYSAIRYYQLVYRPQGSKRNYTISGEVYATARQYTLYNLLPGSTYQVCVIASNNAGSSQTDWNGRNAPCSTFSTKSSYKSIFAALTATSGLFLIVTITLSVCLCRKLKAPHVEQYNTHLVSYKNPAFDYSLK